MLKSSFLKTLLATAAVVVGAASCATFNTESGFVSLFDGRTLNGWTLMGKKGDGYGVRDGVIYCARGGGGNLFTEKEFADFVLRLEFRLEDGSNNGVGIRAPLEGDAAYAGMEIQMLDDSSKRYAGKLKPWQYHGSVYNVFPAKQGALKPVGQWNEEEITAIGRHIVVKVNGKVVVDGDLNTVTDPETIRKHPGIFREQGHIGFLGHDDYIEARNIRIKELPRVKLNNLPPAGFTRLFNGRDLEGWRGLVGNPKTRAKMPLDEWAQAQLKADEKMSAHWSVVNGEITFDGKGDNLCTANDYGDFELLVDWKIPPKGDSGIYLRGSPQVQIWEKYSPGQFDPFDGSGGLYNNQKAARHPLKVADHFVGDWNTFRIVMVGEKVHVFLNGELVVRDTTLENYWERDRPIYPTGSIELQNHGGPLWFRNIYVRELAPPPAKK